MYWCIPGANKFAFRNIEGWNFRGIETVEPLVFFFSNDEQLIGRAGDQREIYKAKSVVG